MSKDVIIAGAIAVGCIALIAVAFIAPKSKSSSEAETPKTETTTTTLTDPSFGATSGLGATSGMATGGLDPLNPNGGINTLPPIGSTTGGATGSFTGLPPVTHPGFGTTSNFGTAGATTSGLNTTGGFSGGTTTGSNFDTQLHGPAPIAAPVDATPVTSETKTHTVANGELLGDIALKYYKSSKQWRKIAEANPGIDPKNLKVGQKLIIPGVEAKPVANTTVVAAPGERTYTIKSGDTLYVVAKKELGSASRWKEIEKLNGVSSNELHVGQVIKLPAAASTATPTTDTGAPAPATSGKTHTVAKGETLGDISKQYYGTTKNWKKIVDANPGTSPEDLKVGQKLVIPDVVGSAPVPALPGTDKAIVAAPAGEYVIKAGDTLGSIALKELGSKNRWKDLQDANPGLDPRNLRAGQKIKIPGKKSDAAPAAPEKVMPPPAPASPFGTPGLGAQPAPGTRIPGAPTAFGAPMPGQQPSAFPSDPTFASPYGGANFGEPAQPFGQTGPGFSQTGTAPTAVPGAAPAGQFPGQPSPFSAPGAGGESSLR